MEADIRNEIESRMTHFLMQSNIKESIQRAAEEKTRCNINLDELRKFDKVLGEAIFKTPEKVIAVLERKLNEMIQDFKDESITDKMRAQNDSKTFPTKTAKSTVGFTGNFGRNHITPRGLKANMLNKLVKVQGIVTKMSIVNSKLSKSYHYVESTKTGVIKNYTDNYSINEEGAVDRSHTFPLVDAAGNKMTAEYGFWEYSKLQRLVIQELPERAPPGQLPRSVTVILENDLVDKVKPGDRVEVTGVYKSIPGQYSSTSGVFQTIIYATGIEEMIRTTHNDKIDPADIANIKKLAQRKDWFDVLANSVAPSIYGHHNVKKGILLQLVGGNEKNLKEGTHLRGDINILMVGDPSTAKSQLLRQVMEIAPLAINTTGRGSSGVGLTAAVIIDKDSGERHLEAGAMVLGDRGIVCIDEFDKMNDADRVAIHEVMEQQTVTISKAGIHASLNARCSVIAAANPTYGDYDKSISAARNIGLPDSLLSRFDLLFVVLDTKDPEVNGKVAERVIFNHRFKKPGDKTAVQIDHNDFLVEPELPVEEEGRRKVYEHEFSALISGKGKGDTPHENILNRDFLKKYLSYVKSSLNPELTEEAVDFLSSSYSMLRQKGEEPDQSKEKKLPITVRSLETLIRLATAHAKIRLSQKVTVDDMKEALGLLNYSIFGYDQDDEQMIVEEQEEKEETKEETKDPHHKNGEIKRSKKKELPSSLQVSMAEARMTRKTAALQADNKENMDSENQKRITRSAMTSKEQVDYVLNASIGKVNKDEVMQSRKMAIYKILTNLKKKHSLADSFSTEVIMDEIQNASGSKYSKHEGGRFDVNDRHSLKTEVNEVIYHLNEEKKVMLLEGGWILI